jgi:hypothetical protein
MEALGPNSRSWMSPVSVGQTGVPSGPGGLRWRLTAWFSRNSRKRRYDIFVQTMRPTASDTILDIGVNDTNWRASNFLEAWYPWPDRITAIATEPRDSFRRIFPEVRFVVADGRQLPFHDDSFSIGFANAVVEHVGTRAEQERFVAEMLRTCRRVFIATPNAKFPVDPHTLLPFVHWLPRRVRHAVLNRVGLRYWADERVLNPLAERDLRRLFPAEREVRIERQRLLGLTTVLIATTRTRSPARGSDSDADHGAREVPGRRRAKEKPIASSRLFAPG